MDDRCRIGNEPATRSLGSYRFCDRHYERALRQRGSLWRADLVSLARRRHLRPGRLSARRRVEPTPVRWGIGRGRARHRADPDRDLVRVLLPWDRLEPEPKTLVLRVGLLGALAAAALAIPLVESVFDIGAWLNRGIVSQVLGNIFVVGFVQMGLVYLVVRLSVYESPEFDEWTDGILYGTAAGLGLATVLNLEFILGSGGADLGLAAIRVALTALVLASLGGLVGYFLGHDRLEVRPVWYVPAGVALAAVLDGIFWYLRSSLSGGLQSGGISTTWVGLILAGVLAAVVTVFLAIAVRDELSRAFKGAGGAPGGSGPVAQGAR